MIDWIVANWEKVGALALSIGGALWAVVRKFNGRISGLEDRVGDLEEGATHMKEKNVGLEKNIMTSFDKIEEKFKEMIDLRVFVERQDVLLQSIHESLRDIKEDVKSLMRNED